LNQQQIERFVRGDRAMVREIYREYGRGVYAVGYRVLRDHGLAEEAVQTTLLNAWRGADTFEIGRDLGPWLYAIARRSAIDIYRREQRHRSRALFEADVVVLPESLDETWQVWQVQLALRRLPDEELEVIRCTHFLGMTHEQTAEHLEVPVGTVKSRSHRAYRRLASLLEGLIEEASA
jgi:RNA polymerase sigma factor (sigma-70 family)